MVTENSTRRYYEEHASEYFRSTCDVDLSSLWNKLEERLRPGALILDLGCGSGRDLLHFSQRGFRVIGLDYSLNLLKLAKTLSRQPVVLGDIRRLPFKENTFDAVWAVGSLLHISHTVMPSVLRQINKVLKPHALFFGSMKKGYGEILDTHGRYTVFYQPHEWSNILRENGFGVIQLEETKEIRRDVVGSECEIIWIESLAQAQAVERAHFPTEAEALSALR